MSSLTSSAVLTPLTALPSLLLNLSSSFFETDRLGQEKALCSVLLQARQIMSFYPEEDSDDLLLSIALGHCLAMWPASPQLKNLLDDVLRCSLGLFHTGCSSQMLLTVDSQHCRASLRSLSVIGILPSKNCLPLDDIRYRTLEMSSNSIASSMV